jgi:hypothetical protein
MKGKEIKGKTDVAHRLHVTLASKPSKCCRHQLLFREREKSSAPTATASSARAVARAHFPASRVIVAECKVPPTKLARRYLPLLARRHLPLLPPVMATASATSRRGRRLLYSRAALTPSCSCHHDSLPGMSNGGQIPSPYSQIQGDGAPHLSKPP